MKWTTKSTKFLFSFTVKKRVFSLVVFLLKHSIRINQWLYFNIKSTGDMQVIVIPLTFSYKSNMILR